MNPTARLYFKTASVLLVISILAGIFMSASGDHRAAGAHAHFSLIGFVLTTAYGAYFGLTPERASGRMPILLLALHTAGAVGMFAALWLLLTGTAAAQPIVALSSFVILSGAVLFGYLVWRPAEAARAVTSARA